MPHLVDVELCSIPRDIPIVKGELYLIAQLQSVVSTGPLVISSGGGTSDALKALDQKPDRDASFENPFLLVLVKIRKLI